MVPVWYYRSWFAPVTQIDSSIANELHNACMFDTDIVPYYSTTLGGVIGTPGTLKNQKYGRVI